jgi:hypothetical protein
MTRQRVEVLPSAVRAIRKLLPEVKYRIDDGVLVVVVVASSVIRRKPGGGILKG